MSESDRITTCWQSDIPCPECGAMLNRSSRRAWCAADGCGYGKGGSATPEGARAANASKNQEANR